MLLCAATGASAQTVSTQVDTAGYIDSGISSRRAAAIDANEAARRLGQAQLQRRHGVEPLPGELAGGTSASVANHRYWRRQEKLRQIVEQAQRRSNETRQSHLALR